MWFRPFLRCGRCWFLAETQARTSERTGVGATASTIPLLLTHTRESATRTERGAARQGQRLVADSCHSSRSRVPVQKVGWFSRYHCIWSPSPSLSSLPYLSPPPALTFHLAVLGHLLQHLGAAATSASTLPSFASSVIDSRGSTPPSFCVHLGHHYERPSFYHHPRCS